MKNRNHSPQSPSLKQMMYPQAVSHGNVLTFTPPGFKQTLNVKFPDCRLAVCERCKKNYKTRDMCRVRNGHTDAPWTTAFICITLEDSCTGPDGKFIDKPLTVRMVQWQPFCVKKSFDKKTPVCAACKKTNRTRAFCRERHKHKQLPWCTVYVLLSALENTDPSTVVAAPSKPVSSDSDAKNDGDTSEETNIDEAKANNGIGNKDNGESAKDNADAPTAQVVKSEESEQAESKSGRSSSVDTTKSADLAAVEAAVDFVKAKTKKQEESDGDADESPSSTVKTEQNGYDNTKGSVNGTSLASSPKKVKSSAPVKSDRPLGGSEDSDPGDDINAIEDSRTFLVMVSCKKVSIHWLELADFDAATAAAGASFCGGSDTSLGVSLRSPAMPVPTGLDPTQYYSQMQGQMGQYAHQHALKMQQQHFMQMQQRQQQHFAAQQAAWQAQYNHQIQMQVQANPGMVPVPGMVQAAGVVQAPGVAAAPGVSATPGVAAASGVVQAPGAVPAPGTLPTAALSPAPGVVPAPGTVPQPAPGTIPAPGVMPQTFTPAAPGIVASPYAMTAAQTAAPAPGAPPSTAPQPAAAEEQKTSTTDESSQPAPSSAALAQPAQQQAFPGAVAAAQQQAQAQAHAQWQAHVMYQQQLYHQQIQMQQAQMQQAQMQQVQMQQQGIMPGQYNIAQQPAPAAQQSGSAPGQQAGMSSVPQAGVTNPAVAQPGFQQPSAIAGAMQTPQTGGQQQFPMVGFPAQAQAMAGMQQPYMMTAAMMTPAQSATNAEGDQNPQKRQRVS
uniref:Uncharacterized protein n=1 Tax=Ditylum brightwellii TaxID=49249 RepID=A0A6V2GSE2_9STRA